MCNEGGTAPPGEGGNIHKREGGREGGRERDFFPFFSLSNKQSAEKRNKCKFIFAKFVLFSRKKKTPWPKISTATVNLD